MSKKKNELPDDLGIKIGSPREAFLTKVKGRMQEEVEDCERTIDLNKIIIKRLDEEIELEKENFK